VQLFHQSEARHAGNGEEEEIGTITKMSSVLKNSIVEAFDEEKRKCFFHLFTPCTCPFLTMFMTSYPCSVFHAVSGEKKPNPGLTRRLMKR